MSELSVLPKIGKSPCSSNKHSEYSCLIKWGVSSKKFSVDKWCDGCIQHHSKTHIVQVYLAQPKPEKKTRKSRNAKD